jgi:hypothetical protein
MKNISPIKTNHLLLNVTGFVICLPWLMLPLFIQGASIGLPMFAYEGYEAPLKECVAPLVTYGALVLIASILILWKGRVMMGLAVVWGLLFVTSLYSGWTNSAGVKKSIALNLGTTDRIRGVDVYCNGVHLGKTPLRITREEFQKKVEPWLQPPRQERMIVDPNENKFQFLYTSRRYYWVPSDLFEAFDEWPPTFPHPNDPDQVRNLLTTARHWWHFEENGCAGVSHISGMSSMGSQGSGTHIEIMQNPPEDYPSLAPHLDLLLVALEQSGFEPTREWLAHFRKYQDQLFTEFCQKLRKDSRLQPTLNALVRAEFDLPEQPTEKDCERVVEDVLRRAEKMGGFMVPSIESAALDLLGETASPVLVRLYPREARHGRGSWGTSGGGNWTFIRRSGKAARQIPLEYMIEGLRPPELHDFLVYESQRNPDLLALVGRYRRKETVAIVRNYLREVTQKRDYFLPGQQIREAISLVAKMRNPDLDDILDEFLRDNVSAKFPDNFEAKDYIQSRIGRSDVDQNELASWIHAFAPLDEKDKEDFIMRINSPSVDTLLRVLGVDRDWQKRNNVIEYAAGSPNPALDKFLVDTYRALQASEGQAYSPSQLGVALAQTDTPLIRKFLSEEWDKGEKNREFLLRRIREYALPCPGLTWMVPKIAEAKDRSECDEVAALLFKIHTPESRKALEEWADDATSPDAQRAARAQLDGWSAEERKAAEKKSADVARAAELISGKIKPDDLLPPATPYVWDGKDYVPATVE